MDVTRTRRARDRARQVWYATQRQRRFARFLQSADVESIMLSNHEGPSTGNRMGCRLNGPSLLPFRPFHPR